MKRFHVTTFGCQMNEHDSERMKGMLESLGYAEVPERENADLILFNTCSIREKADERFVARLIDHMASRHGYDRKRLLDHARPTSERPWDVEGFRREHGMDHAMNTTMRQHAEGDLTTRQEID